MTFECSVVRTGSGLELDVVNGFKLVRLMVRSSLRTGPSVQFCYNMCGANLEDRVMLSHGTVSDNV